MERTTDAGNWNDHFARERERVIGALGALTDGGVVEHAEHVGTTSVPGLLGQPCLDLALAVWPFPLGDPALAALSALGYDLDHDAAASTHEQRLRHASAPLRLFVVEAGSPAWTDFLLLREHLRHDAAARQAFSARKQGWGEGPASSAYREAKRQWFAELLPNAHRSWIEREGFAPLGVVVEEMRDFPPPWHLCGGWALDVYLGRVTRVHHDRDVVVARADQLALQEHLRARGWTLQAPFEGRLQPWPMHMRLELPRHQIHAHRRGVFLDFLLADVDGGVWRYRRDPVVVRDLSRMGLRSAEGVPLLAPELVLLFKSKNTSGRERSKDQVDFEAVSGTLEPERRAWLRWALLASDPSHPWIERL